MFHYRRRVVTIVHGFAKWSAVFLALSSGLVGAASGHAQSRYRPQFTLEQITQVRTIGEWDLSLDGTRIAYTLRGYFYGFGVVPRFGEDNNVFMVDVRTGEIRKMTSGLFPKTNPKFSPDGSRILYEADDDLWVVEVATGESRRLTVSPAADRDGDWSPDGRSVVFVSNRSERYGELGGATDLWIVSTDHLRGDSARTNPRRLTRDLGVAPREPKWSPDGDTIGFAAAQRFAPERQDPGHLYAAAIYTVPSSGGDAQRITPDDNVENFRPVWSPDGRRLAYLSDRNGYIRVWTMNADGSDAREFDTGPHDSHSPHFEVAPVWSRDGSRLLVSVNREGRYDLDVLDLSDGSASTVARAVDAGGGHYHALGWGPRGEWVYAWENAWSPPDLYVRPQGSGPDAARQLTFSSHAAFRPEHFPRIERVAITSADGLELTGFLVTPRDLREGDRLPGIVNIHTNTYGQFYDHWTPFFHYLVESGYAMLMVDQRGSAGYGRSFRSAILGAFDQEVLDDVTAMARFLKTRPFVDPDRVGAMGMSHGGYRTMLSMARTPELFAAGVNAFGPSDRRTPYLNANGRFHIGATEAEDPELYERLSPITMVDRMQSPLLILHSNQDRNVPGAMSYKLVEELERHDKEYDVAYYPDEAHGLADPTHQFDAFRRIVGFFARYLQR